MIFSVKNVRYISIFLNNLRHLYFRLSVTGLPVWTIILAVGGVCTFYTTLVGIFSHMISKKNKTIQQKKNKNKNPSSKFKDRGMFSTLHIEL